LNDDDDDDALNEISISQRVWSYIRPHWVFGKVFEFCIVYSSRISRKFSFKRIIIIVNQANHACMRAYVCNNNMFYIRMRQFASGI